MNALSPQYPHALSSTTALSTITPSAELIAACARFCELERAWVVAGAGNIEYGSQEEAECTAERDRIKAAQAPMVDRILGLPCTTLPGLQAVAGALANWDLELLKDAPADLGKLLTAKLVASLLTRAPMPDADAELIAVCADFRASETAFCALYDDAAIDDDAAAEEARAVLASPILHGWHSMLDRMAALRAETFEGVAARALALAQHSGIKAGASSYAFGFEPDGDTVTGRLLHYLLRDALAVLREAPSNPDAQLLSLRPEYERLRAEIDAENARPGDWTDEITETIGKPFDDICKTIIGMPPAATRAGRALKAIVAMHELAYDGANFEEADSAMHMCWNMLKQEVGEEFLLPGARS